MPPTQKTATTPPAPAPLNEETEDDNGTFENRAACAILILSRQNLQISLALDNMIQRLTQVESRLSALES